MKKLPAKARTVNLLQQYSLSFGSEVTDPDKELFPFNFYRDKEKDPFTE